MALCIRLTVMMILNSDILKEIKKIALITLGAICVMIALFAVRGYFSWGVVVSGFLGGAVAILNFFLLAVTVEKSLSKGSKGAQGFMGVSYLLRMALIAAVLIFAIKSEHLNYIAVAIPLIFPQIIIKILYTKNPSKEKKQDEC